MMVDSKQNGCRLLHILCPEQKHVRVPSSQVSQSVETVRWTKAAACVIADSCSQGVKVLSVQLSNGYHK